MMKYVLIILCFSSVWLFGQDVQVTLRASKTEVVVGEKFTIVLSSNTKGSGTVNMPEGIEIISRMKGSSSTNINGKENYESTLTLNVVANKTGTFTIPPATWKQSLTKKHKSNELKINVKAGSGGGSTNVQNNPQSEGNGKHFAFFTTNKKEVYVGEPIVITGKIYFDGHIVDLNSIQLYNTDMMLHKTDVSGNNGALNLSGELYQGRVYESILLFEELIVPQQSGKLNFDAFSINVGYQKGFFGQGYQMLISNPLQIQVLPLPPGAPSNFDGALGKYTITASHNIKGKLKAGDIFSYKVRLEGSGNIHMLKPLTLNLPNGLIMYGEPVIDNQVFATKEGAHGHIDYEFIIQVQNGGNYDFTPLEFSFFNPEKKIFETLYASELTFEALGNENEEALTTDLSEKEQPNSSWWKTLIFIVLAAGIIILGAYYFLKKNRTTAKQTSSKKPKIDARAVALKSLETVPTQNLKETADALEKIILQYFRDSSQNNDLLLDKAWWFSDEASKLKLTAEMAERWSQHFDKIQGIKYAGFGLESAEQLVGKTKELVG